MQDRTLSSAWTFWTKFVLPAAWILILGTGNILLWSGNQVGKDNTVPPPEMKFAHLGAWILGTAFILWFSVGLKRVRIGEGQLHLSNYVREIAVPFSAITDVKQDRWLSHRPVTIYFRDATEFGDKVKFIPKQTFQFRFWRADPVVEELKQLAGLVR